MTSLPPPLPSDAFRWCVPRPRFPSTSLNVLFVDDELCIRQLMRELLRDSGLFAETAADGPDALAKFKAGQWDLVFTDYAMPGMNGEELAMELKNLSPSLPVIMVTGHAQVPLSKSAIDSVVEKPFTRDKLFSAIWHTLLQKTEGAGR